MSDITFVSTLSDVEDRPSIPSAEGGLAVKPKFPLKLDSKIVKEGISSSINEMAEYLDQVAKQQEGKSFVLDQVEMTMQISQGGKVNIFVADVSGQVQGGIKLVWKRDTKA